MVKCLEIKSNWISRRTVQKFALHTRKREREKFARYEGKALVSTGMVVELGCLQASCTHHFHVIETSSLPCDILCGAEFAGKEHGAIC